MKKLFLLSALFATLLVTNTSCTRISPTEAGFKISNSGNYRGLDSLPLLTGWEWYMPGVSYIVTIPTTQQHIVWTEDEAEGSAANQEIKVSCMGGAGFGIDVGLNYRIDPNKASKIYLKYNTDNLSSISDTYLRNAVRGAMQDISGHITVDSLLNNLPGFEAAVREQITERLRPEGFIVDLFNVLNRPRPTSKELAVSIDNKIKAKQDAETAIQQLQTSVAEANKKIATARGDSASYVIEQAGKAEGIKKMQQELTPTYVDYIKWLNAGDAVPRVPNTILGSGAGVLLSK